MFRMNDFTFPDEQDEPMNYRNQAPPIVAPWFAYAVGSIVAIAALMVSVEVVRFEMLMNDVRNIKTPVFKPEDFRVSTGIKP